MRRSFCDAAFTSLLLFGAWTILSAGTVRAWGQTTYTVTRFDDTAANVTYTNPSDGLGAGVAGDLRYEMLQAMAAGGNATINFNGCSTTAPCTITLNGPLPPIFEINNPSSFSLTVDGGAEGAVILDGNSGNGGTNRVFFVDNVTVTLKNLVIQNAKAQGGAGSYGGGGGAGFGAGLFVNQASAAVSVFNTSLLNCSVAGGSGGGGGQNTASTAGGGGGMAFPGSDGGGGVAGPGGGTVAEGAGGSGGSGGGGGGSGYIYVIYSIFRGGPGGNGYASNGAGTSSNGASGGDGGFGGGGGSVFGTGGGTGGFGGGGGGGHSSDSGPGGPGGFGGGGGGGQGGFGGSASAVGGVAGGGGGAAFIKDGGGGGAAAGPAIFVNAGALTLQNVTGSGFSATAGAGGPGATSGTASTAAIFNYEGTVNGSTTVGGLQGALPVGGSNSGTVYGGTPVGQTSAVQTASLLITTAGTPAALNVLTQGSPNLDFKLVTGGSCSTASSYGVGTFCTVSFTFAPSHPGLRTGGIALTSSTGAVLASAYISGIGAGPQVAFNAASTTVTTLGGGFTLPHPSAVDAAGNVYVGDSRDAAVYEIPAGCASASCVVSLGGVFSGPDQVAMDGLGDLYVADQGIIKQMPPNCGSASCVTPIGAATGASGGLAIAVDLAGNVFTDNAGGVEEIPAGCTNSGCAITLIGLDGVTTGTASQAAVDAADNLYFATGGSSVALVPSGCRSSSCVGSLGGGFSAVRGVALDGSGKVYVYDLTQQTLSVMPASCASASCVTLLQSGLLSGVGLAADASGNLYLGQRVTTPLTGASTVKQFALATPPAVNFAKSITDGSTDTTDGTQTVQVFNNGNEPLVFSSLTYGTDFPEAGGDSAACYNSISLAAGAECDLPITFAPVSPASGALGENVNLTDNALNASDAMQSVTVTGTAIAPIIVPALTTYFGGSPATMPVGGNVSYYVSVANPSSTSAIANGTVTISLPAGLQVVAGSLGTTCPGSVTYSPSSSTITHAGISLGGNGSCQDGFTFSATGLGLQTVNATATVGTITGSNASTQVTVVDVPASLAIGGTPSSAYLGGSVPFTVTAVDPLGNTDAAYAGTVSFASSDSAAGLPGSYTFQPGDQGTHTFSATLNTAGSQTITATDSANGLSVTSSGIAVSIPNLVVTTATDDAGTASNCTVQHAPGSGTDSSCSLRDALAEAASLGSANITFSSTAFATAQTITLGSAGTMNIPANTTITGPTTGSGPTLTQLVTVSGNHAHTVFQVNPGVVAISGLTIANGVTTSELSAGGITVSGGSLTVSNSTFSGNSTTGGIDVSSGAIANFSFDGTVTVSNSTFSGNFTSNLDFTVGAIGNFSRGTVTVSNSTFSGNSGGNANQSGGAIENEGNGTITLKNNLFDNNSSTGPSSSNGVNNLQGTTNASHNLFADGDQCSGCSETNDTTIPGSSNLGPLGSYGGPTQTLLPLPGSAAICAGVAESVNSTPITADQRGVAIPTTYNGTRCYDIGAVQTDYALSFSTQPPASVLTGTPMSPAPAVTVTEDGNLLTAASASVTLTDSASDLISVPATATTSAGIAPFSGLQFTNPVSSDGLTAVLGLDNSNGQAISTIATSNSFNVVPQLPTLTAFFGGSPTTMPLSGNVSYSVSVANPSTTAALSNATVTIGLPAGLQVVAGSLGTTCPGIATYSPSSSTITHTGISLSGNGNCQDGFTFTATGLGLQTVSATAAVGTTTGSNASTPVTVVDVPASLAMGGTPSSAYLGGSVPFTVTAVDPLGNTDAAYTGTVSFTSSDPAAGLPGSYTFTAADAGSHQFKVTFGTVGSQTVTAADSANSLGVSSGSITVSIPNLVVNQIGDDGGTASNCAVQTSAGTTTTFDSCYLRDALLEAASLGSANISFDGNAFASAQTIALGTAGTMNIPSYTTITGPTTGSGATLTQLVTVSGANTYQVFRIGPGETGVSINGLAIANGSEFGSGSICNSNGGAICAYSSLSVSNSSFSNNSAENTSGAIYANTGLTVTNSTFTGNSSQADAGAIHAQSTLTVTNSTFSGNSTRSGGAIYAQSTLVVGNSTFSGNSAGNFGQGGAISAQSTLTVTNSSFSGNSAVNSGEGGAINAFSTLTVTNSTFSGNSAANRGSGGAIYAQSTLTVNNSIFANNSADGDTAVVASGGAADHNLFYGGDSCNGCTTNTNAVSGDPILAPLGSYGGPSQTFLPLPGSAAICAGVAESVNSSNITADQRGVAIPMTYGTQQCYDIGAVQTDYAMSFTTEPPASLFTGTLMTPAPAVTVTESGNALTAGSATVTVKDSANDLTTTPQTASTSLGIATFSTLQFTTSATGDQLVAALSLNPVLSTPLSLTTESSAFDVVAAMVNVPSVVGDTQPAATTAILGAGLVLGIVTNASSNTVPSGDVISENPAAATSVTPGSAVNIVVSTGPVLYVLNVAANNADYGTVTPTTGSSYASGTTVDITAAPSAGYYFTGWTGSTDIASASSASTTIAMNGTESITANFAKIGYILWIGNPAGTTSAFLQNGAPYLTPANSAGGTGVAIDSAGNVWSLNAASDSVAEFAPDGTITSSGYTGGGLSTSTALAIDGHGQVWITNTGGSISVFNSAGTPVTPTSGYTAGTSSPASIAVDISGNVWIANHGGNSVTKLLGAAAPTVPLATGVANGTPATNP